MLQALIITLREGFGAFLVVGVMLAIFRRAGEYRLLAATRWGISLSVVATVIAAALFSRAENQALWEGVLAIAAAVSVGWMGVHMWRTTRSRAASRQPNRWTGLATMFMTVLMITRGSMEIALLLGIMLWQVPALEVIFGAAAGTICAIVLAWLWARFGRRMPQPYFRQVTAIFLCVLFLQLAIDGFHEITEANVLAGAEPLHWATEPFSSDGTYGQYAPYLLIGAPLAWWVIAIFWGHGKASAGGVAHLGR